MQPWRGKWALVTGASAGIGSALAEQLAAQGVNLLLTARRADRLARLANDLAARHKVQTEIYAADLTRPQAPGEIFRFTEQKRLPVELLINNAGFGAYGEFRKQEAQRLLDMVQVNVASVVHLTHLFLPAMVERRSGSILILASTAAFQPVPYLGAYAATKGFDLLFAESLAEEVRQYGVHVCALCPGSTVSEFHEVAGASHVACPQEPNEKVARVGLEALAAGKALVISGTRNLLSMEAQRLVPRRLVTRIVARMFKPRV
jgi:short-subunit dehydrogenase